MGYQYFLKNYMGLSYLVLITKKHFTLCLHLEAKDVQTNYNATLNNDFGNERDFSNDSKVIKVQGLLHDLLLVLPFDRYASNITNSTTTKFCKYNVYW